MFGVFWKDLGGQNRCQNRFLGIFFSKFFSSAFRHRFWVDFWRLENREIIKNNCLFNGFYDFLQNRRFRKKCQKSSILESFSETKTTKNREHIVLKITCFFDIDFSAFFFGFLRFRLDCRRPQPFQKSLKN